MHIIYGGWTFGEFAANRILFFSFFTFRKNKQHGSYIGVSYIKDVAGRAGPVWSGPAWSGPRKEPVLNIQAGLSLVQEPEWSGLDFRIFQNTPGQTSTETQACGGGGDGGGGCGAGGSGGGRDGGGDGGGGGVR